MKDVNTRVLQLSTDVENPEATLQVDETPIPQPKDTEALVRFILRPVNPADVLMMQGLYGSSQPEASQFPLVIGLEGVAVIVKSKKFSPGTRVVAQGWGRGTWQTYRTVPEDKLVAVPSEVTDAQAAVMWINPVTVLGVIKTLDVPKGEWLVQSAAGSAFGRQVLQVCKHYGIKTINVIRRSSQKQELLDLGADIVIATDEEEVGPAVAKITGGKGAYAGLDPVGGELTGQLLASLREYGTLCVYGMLSGTTSTVNIPDLLFRGKRLHGYHLRDYWGSLDSTGQADLVQEIFKLLSTGVIVEYVGKTFPLENAKEAVKESQKSGRGGKVFLSS